MGKVYSFIVLTMALVSFKTLAWSNHGLDTYVALRKTSLAKSSKVKTESLETFLEATKNSLSETLRNIDKKILQLDLDFANVHQSFNAHLTGEHLKTSFLHSIRVNTSVPYSLYLQNIPSVDSENRKAIELEQASIIKDVHLARKLLSLKENEAVHPLLILSSYVDEPDFGMDIGLFEDSPNSKDGPLYGFGNTPFGNPRLEFASQAPFHMGFYFESWLTYTFKPDIQRTYPLVRILQYRELSRFAFKAGHPYWGFRFAAWALHYVQDLTQPYHSSLVPGASDSKKVLAALLNMVHLNEAQDDLINEITNLHLAFEDYQFFRLTKALNENNKDDDLILALETDPKDVAPITQFERIKDVVAKVSHHQAQNLRNALVTVIKPDIYLSADPGKIDYYQLIESLPQEKKEVLYKELHILMGHLGQHTRDFILSINTSPK